MIARVSTILLRIKSTNAMLAIIILVTVRNLLVTIIAATIAILPKVPYINLDL